MRWCLSQMSTQLSTQLSTQINADSDEHTGEHMLKGEAGYRRTKAHSSHPSLRTHWYTPAPNNDRDGDDDVCGIGAAKGTHGACVGPCMHAYMRARVCVCVCVCARTCLVLASNGGPGLKGKPGEASLNIQNQPQDLTDTPSLLIGARPAKKRGQAKDRGQRKGDREKEERGKKHGRNTHGRTA
eukprot:1158683-Pelagomonas_calceolata.AAC.5